MLLMLIETRLMDMMLYECVNHDLRCACVHVLQVLEP